VLRRSLGVRIEASVVSAREEELVEEVEVGGRRVLRRLPPQKAYTTCNVYADEREEAVLIFAVCRPGPPGTTKWARRRPPLVIPHRDFATCDAKLYREKYKLGETISGLLAEACRKLREKYGARLAPL